VSKDGKIRTTLREDVAATCRTCAFEKLEVVAREDGATSDEGYVTFKAHFKIINQKGSRQKGSKTECLSVSEGSK
jgi:uncharacterized protein YchJ